MNKDQFAWLFSLNVGILVFVLLHTFIVDKTVVKQGTKYINPKTVYSQADVKTTEMGIKQLSDLCPPDKATHITLDFIPDGKSAVECN